MEDKELLKKIRNPESKLSGFNQLVKNYQEKVYWIVRKMVIDHEDANDLTQDVFVKIWKNIDKFRADSQLYTWVYRIATNECLNFLKKKQRRYFIPWQDAKNELMDKVDNSNLVSGYEIQKQLQKALLTLPDKQRLVFNLKYFEELKYEQIAEITDTSVGSLKASYHHAVKKIENIIKTN